MEKESDFVGLSRTLTGSQTNNSKLQPIAEETEDVNEAARRFLKTHHEQALFKAKELIEKARPSDITPSIEQPETIVPNNSVPNSSIVIKQRLKQTFSSAQVREINLRAVNRIRTPSLTSQAVSALIDTFVILNIATILMALYVLAFEPAFRTQILVPQHWDLADQFLFGGIFKAALILCVVIYPIACFKIMNRTIGQKATGTKLVRYGQYSCSWSDVILRAINLPLSMCLLGFLPIFFGKRPLHDLAAGTAITRD